MPIGELLFGSPGGFTQAPSGYSPEQQQALNTILQQALAGLQPQNLGQGFEPIEQHARQQFQQQTIPTIAERFSALGSGGSQRSSAFQQALGSAGAGLESQLAAQKAQFGQQQQGNLLNLLNLGLTPQRDYLYERPTSGLLGGLSGGVGMGAGSLLTLLLSQLLGGGLR